MLSNIDNNLLLSSVKNNLDLYNKNIPRTNYLYYALQATILFLILRIAYK